jgi:hypothetical protein
MKTPHHVVRKGKALVTETEDALMEVHSLKSDIVIACHNAAHHRSGLCHSSEAADIRRFLEAMLPLQEKAGRGGVQVRLVGGTDSDASRRQLEKILRALEAFDDRRNVLDILSADVMRKQHPDSFMMTAGDGMLHAIE